MWKTIMVREDIVRGTDRRKSGLFRKIVESQVIGS